MSEEKMKLSDTDLDAASSGENIREDDNPSEETGRTRSRTPYEYTTVFEQFDAS